jgi:hypothetical protein
MRIIPRAEWGARSPRAVTHIALPTPRLWVHHTAGSERGAVGMRQIQAFHMDTRGWNDIAYSFVVDDHDGAIYEGRGAGVAGGHTEGDNSRSHAICVMGNFEGRGAQPHTLQAIVELANHGTAKGWWVPTLGGHRDAPGASTACPGARLYAVLPNLRASLGAPIPPPEEDEMALTDDTKDWLRKLVADSEARIVRAIADKDTEFLIKGSDSPQWWVTDLKEKRYVPNRDHANRLVVFGVRADEGNLPFIWPQADVDALEDVGEDG